MYVYILYFSKWITTLILAHYDYHIQQTLENVFELGSSEHCSIAPINNTHRVFYSHISYVEQ